MTALLPAVLPVALIILIGFIAGRLLPLEHQTLSQLSIYILAPALVADSLYRTTLPLQSSVGLLISFSCLSIALYIGVWIIGKLLKLSSPVQKSLMATTLFPNNGNMGLPLIDFALGAAGLERAIIYMLGSSILMFGVAPALLAGKTLGDSIRLTLKLPLIWAIAGGSSLRLLAIELPFQLDTAIEQLGRAAIPIALLLLGMQLGNTAFRIGIYELFATAIRLLVAPLVACAIGYLMGLTGLDLQVLILQSAMPAAVNTIVLATEFGADVSRVARTIVVSTLLSFVTLPIILWISSIY